MVFSIISNAIFSLLWLRLIRYIQRDYQETQSRGLLVAEIIVVLICFTISILWIRSTLWNNTWRL